MKSFDRLMWCGCVLAWTMILVGAIYREKALLFLGYVFGFPLLLVPLVALASWSEKRQARKKVLDDAKRKIG